MRLALSAAAGCLALASLLSAQGQITWVEPDGSVRMIAENGTTPTDVLDDAHFLHLNLTHWFPQVTTRQHTTRLATGAGLEWIELPGNGRLLRYQREANRFRGWLWLRADGVPEVLVEADGDRAAEVGDRIAVGFDGRHAVIPVGDATLYVAKLDATTGAQVQSIAAPAPIKVKSVTVGRQAAYVQTVDQRLLRIRFGTSTLGFEDVTPPTAKRVDLESEMAVSGDGEVVVLVAGLGTSKQLWCLRGLQQPELLTARGADVQAADYTTCVAGPTLLLNHDGSRLFFAVRTGAGHHGNLNHYEFYLADITQPAPSLQISADANFAAYIGTSVLPTFADIDKPAVAQTQESPLLVAVGYPAREDWYAVARAEQPARNITRTNGQTVPPFEAGELSPRVSFSLSNGNVISLEDVTDGRALRYLARDGSSTRIVEPLLYQNPMLGSSLGQRAARVLVVGSLGEAQMSIDGMVPVYRAAPGAKLTTSVVGVDDLYEVMVEHGTTDELVVLLSGGGVVRLPAPGLRRVTCLPSGAMVFDDGRLTLLQPGRGPMALPAAVGSTVLSGASTNGSTGMAVRVQANPPAEVGDDVAFDVAGVAGNGPFEFSWDFGDGTAPTPFSPLTATSHVFERAGHFLVTVTISDGHNRTRDMFTQTIHHPISERSPAAASTVVLDEPRARLWCVNADNASVTAIATDGLQKVLEVPVGPRPRTLAQAPDGALWVACEDDATLRVLHPVSGVELDRVELPPASRPFGVAVRPDGVAVYVTLRGSDAVAIVDPVTHRVLGRVRLPAEPKGIAVTADSRAVFVTRYLSASTSRAQAAVGEVWEIDAASERLVRTIPLAFDPGPDTSTSGRGVPNCLSSLTISPDGRRLWVPSQKDNIARGLFRDGLPLTPENTVRTIVSQIDLGTRREELAARIDFNNRDMAFAVAFSPLGDYAFQALQGSGAVVVRDAYSGSFVTAIERTGLAPQGLVVSADGSRLFVHNFMSRTVSVYDVSEVTNSTGTAATQLADIGTVGQEALSPEVLLGKQIFYNAADRRMNQSGYISCASCHQDGGEDGQVWDFTDRGEGLRNTTSLLGKAGTREGNLHWTASFDEVQDFENDMRNAFGGTGFLADPLFYSGTVSNPLGQPKAGLSVELDALAAYVSSLRTVGRSPWRDSDGAGGAAAKRGRALFQQLGCAGCHSGAGFTDSPSGVKHDVGTIQAGSGSASGGPLTGFDTPTLRGLWATAPYLHDGSAATLRDVLTTRNPVGKHGATGGLSAEQLDDLVAYLRRIDDLEPGVGD